MGVLISRQEIVLEGEGSGCLFLKPSPLHHLRVRSHLGGEKSNHFYSLAVEVTIEVRTGPDALQPPQTFSHQYIFRDSHSPVTMQDVHQRDHPQNSLALGAKPQCLFKRL